MKIQKQQKSTTPRVQASKNLFDYYSNKNKEEIFLNHGIPQN
jgi:hypothetical protein